MFKMQQEAIQFAITVRLSDSKRIEQLAAVCYLPVPVKHYVK